MFTFKDKLTAQLSRLLGSQSYESPQANYAKGNTYTAVFSSNHPSTGDPEPIHSGDDSKPVRSRFSRWNSKGRASMKSKKMDNQVERMPKDECKEKANALDETPVSAKSTCSEIFVDATEPQRPWNLMPNLTEESSFIYVDLYDFLQSSLPTIVKGCQWILLYSTLRDGISLRTLIRKSADLTGPGLLIVGDRKGAIFGGLLDCPLKACPKRKYQGSIQSFVFTTRYGEPRLFRATGMNRYFFLCLNDLLAFGGGGKFALSMDGDLLTGSSGPCDTFGNSCLAHDPEFELKNVELWGFAHVSRYIT